MTSLRDAIYGAAIGDALGVPYEFMSRGSFIASDMIGYGSHDMPEGTWSDDTSMTLALCDSLRVNDKKIVLDDIRNRFKSWIEEGCYAVDGKAFDVGIITYDSIVTGIARNDIRSNGNGSLMRTIPLAFIECTDDDVRAVSAITHAHETSMEACVIYVNIAKRLIGGEHLVDTINSLEVSEVFHNIKNIFELEEENIRSGGYVVDTLIASLWSLLNTDNYKDAVLKAVNLGNDTDTTAIVAGALAGIIYGYDAIPKRWIELLKNKELIESCLFS